ncbi:TPR end-of-group domain-containing protein [Ekhidna sp. To15]|uniref:TPR end-of-group domain-containing protein n=1 Tax=Ekhidna sp. To15 TaxID=3395267 RepID=UPI003F5250BE
MRKLFYTILTISTLTSSAQGLRELYQEGVQAYEQQDYTLFNKRMYSIDSMRPNYPAVVYNLASSYALLGNPDKSLEVLNKYILMDATQNFSEDKDFVSLEELPAFKAIQVKQNYLTERLDFKKTIEFQLLASHPESITYSEKQKAFFIGGVRDGNIWKIEEGQEPALWAESTKNSWSVMGLEISKDQKVLWACTSSMNVYENFDQNEEGFASVLKYNLKNGELLETFALPRGHNFGDLIVDNEENVYISDGTSNQLYWISKKKGELEVFVDLSERVFNLQGLTLNETQSALFVSDYIDGVYKVNLATREFEKLKIESNDVLIKGIDGLYYDNGSLIGLHNGTNPNRIVRYQLSSDEDKIIAKKTLGQAGTLGEPTQGVWIKDKFYFIMNSPWGAYDKDGNFSPDGDKIIIGIIE